MISLALQKGIFLCFFLSGIGAYLPPFVLRITDGDSDGARSRVEPSLRKASTNSIIIKTFNQILFSFKSEFTIIKTLFPSPSTGLALKASAVSVHGVVMCRSLHH